METLGGPLFAVAGGGESHGPAITTIVFGCPAGLLVERSRLQGWLDLRRPGSSKYGTTRRETDTVVIVSGLYSSRDDLLQGPPVQIEGESTPTYAAGRTTGEPISALVLSTSKRSRDYSQFEGAMGEVRPGHTDLVKYHKSGGFVDVRGGGRSSYRSTISDVIGGSIARLWLQQTFGTRILSSICQVGSLRSTTRLQDLAKDFSDRDADAQDASLDQLQDSLEGAPIRSVDADFAAQAADLIRTTRIQKDSVGAAIEVVAFSPPALVGEPLYQSLKVRVMGSLGGLHAVQSCEVGDGLEVIERRGSENNDGIRSHGYTGNSHGGLLGGITTGLPLVCRVGFKPTSSIPRPQESVRKNLEEIDFQLAGGRHDPCVGVRAGITLESRLAIELANAALMHQAGRVHEEDFRLF